jgi:hypothetical protein
MGLVRRSGTLIPTPLFGVGWLAMPLDRLGDGFSSPVRFWPDFPRSVSPLPVQSVCFPAHSRIAGVSAVLVFGIVDKINCIVKAFRLVMNI